MRKGGGFPSGVSPRPVPSSGGTEALRPKARGALIVSRESAPIRASEPRRGHHRPSFRPSDTADPFGVIPARAGNPHPLRLRLSPRTVSPPPLSPLLSPPSHN